MLTGSRPAMEVVKSDMRSLLLTAGPEGYTLEQMVREHRYLNPGRTIPVRELNFTSLEELLRAMPDVARFSLVDGELRAIAVANEETRHIESLQSASRPRRRQSPDVSRRRPFDLIDLTNSPTIPSIPTTCAPPQPRAGPVLSYSQSTALPLLSSTTASGQNQPARVAVSTAYRVKQEFAAGNANSNAAPTTASSSSRTIAVPAPTSINVAPLRNLGPEFRQMIAQVLVDPSFPEDGLPGADFNEFFQGVHGWPLKLEDTKQKSVYDLLLTQFQDLCKLRASPNCNDYLILTKRSLEQRQACEMNNQVETSLPQDLVSKIRLLLTERESGVLLTNLFSAFQTRFQQELNLTRLGFRSVEELLRSLPGVCSLHSDPATGAYLVLAAGIPLRLESASTSRLNRSHHIGDALRTESNRANVSSKGGPPTKSIRLVAEQRAAPSAGSSVRSTSCNPSSARSRLQPTESSDCAVVAALYPTPSTRSIGLHTSAPSARSREPGELMDSETGSDVIMLDKDNDDNDAQSRASPMVICPAAAPAAAVECLPLECLIRPPSPTPDDVEVEVEVVEEVDLEQNLSDDETCTPAEEYARPSTPPVEPPPPLVPTVLPNDSLRAFIHKIKTLKSDRRFMAGVFIHLMQPYGRVETVSFSILKERFQTVCGFSLDDLEVSMSDLRELEDDFILKFGMQSLSSVNSRKRRSEDESECTVIIKPLHRTSDYHFRDLVEQLIEQRLPPVDVVFASRVNIPQFTVESNWVGTMMTLTADGTKVPTFETLSVIVSYVVSPALFYIQLEDDAIDQLADIEEQMNSLYKSTEGNRYKLSDFSNGLFCAALQASDQFWYRAQLDTPPNADKMVEVTFIDYGNRALVHTSEIRALKASFCTVSRLAHCARLARVVPSNFYQDARRYGRPAIKLMESKVFGRVYSLPLCRIYQNKIEYMTVDIWHETNERVKDWDMAELLIREGLAIYGNEADQFTPKIPLERAKPTSHTPAAVQSTASASIASASISNPAATTPESTPLIVDPNASTSSPHHAEVTQRQLLFASGPPATEVSAAPVSEQQQTLFMNTSPAAPQQVSTTSFTASAPPQPLVLSASAPRLPPWADPTWQPEPLFASTKALSLPSQVFTTLSPPTSSSCPAQSSSTNSCPITTGTALSFFNSPQSYSL